VPPNKTNQILKHEFFTMETSPRMTHSSSSSSLFGRLWHSDDDEAQDGEDRKHSVSDSELDVRFQQTNLDEQMEQEERRRDEEDEDEQKRPESDPEERKKKNKNTIRARSKSRRDNHNNNKRKGEVLNASEKRRRLGLEESSQPFLFPDAERGVHFSNDQLENGGGAAAAPVPEGGEAIAEPRIYTPFCPDSVDWEKVDEEEHNPSDDERCHDCDNDQDEEQREANPAVLEYKRHYEENCFEVERTRLAGQVQKLFNRKVRPYTDGQRFYSKRAIAEHFEMHAPTPTILHALDFRTLNFALKTIRENGLFLKDQDGRVSIDSKEMNNYIKIMKERNLVANKLYDMGKKR
jgi:hypothetical protein